MNAFDTCPFLRQAHAGSSHKLPKHTHPCLGGSNLLGATPEHLQGTPNRFHPFRKHIRHPARCVTSLPKRFRRFGECFRCIPKRLRAISTRFWDRRSASGIARRASRLPHSLLPSREALPHASEACLCDNEALHSCNEMSFQGPDALPRRWYRLRCGDEALAGCFHAFRPSGPCFSSNGMRSGERALLIPEVCSVSTQLGAFFAIRIPEGLAPVSPVAYRRSDFGRIFYFSCVRILSPKYVDRE